ncbi:hypothetical protein UlMin_018101 [Ulmus minor]
MKAGFSSLNPYAAAYIPLSKREAAPTQRTSIPGNVWPGNSGETAQNQYQRNASFGSGAHITGERYGSSSQSVNELLQKQLLDEQFDMELEYLKMTFPGLSDQSLADVYVANRGDLDATIDMLNQLEFHTVESSESLPDSLDIGDVSEPVASTTHCASSTLKYVAGEGSSGSSDTTRVAS